LDTGVDVYAAAGLVVADNMFSGCRACMLFDDYGGRGCAKVRIVANEVKGEERAVTNYPLHFGSSGSVNRVLHEDVTIAANRFTGNGKLFESGNTADMISVHYARAVLIAGNKLSDGGDNGIAVIDSSEVTVIGNEVGRLQHAGIVVEATASVNVVANTLVGNGKDPMTIGARRGIRTGILITYAHHVDSTAVYVDHNRFDDDPKTPTQLEGIHIYPFEEGAQRIVKSMRTGVVANAVNGSIALGAEDADKAFACAPVFRNAELRLPPLSSVPEYSVYSVSCIEAGLNTSISVRAAEGDLVRARPSCDLGTLQLTSADGALTIIRRTGNWEVLGAQNDCIPQSPSAAHGQPRMR